jgi:CDP-glycerol glycerophosphotransferase (TagB/SpsB family)
MSMRQNGSSALHSSISPAARRVVDVLLDCLIVLLAMIGVLFALAGSRWAPLWVLASVLGLAAQLIHTSLGRTGSWSPLGQALVLRSSAAVATAVCLTSASPGARHALGAALGAAILVGSIVVEPFVARATRFRVPIAVRLPDVPTRPQLRDLGSASVAASAAATAFGLLLTAIGASSWWWALISMLAVIAVAVLAVDGRKKIVFARRLQNLVPRAVAAYAPDFVVYTSRPDDATHQVTMWLPYLQRAGRRFIIVTRSAVPAAALAAKTDVPVVEARALRDLEALVVPSLKAAFYVNASSGNGALVRFQHLTHIYLGHGDSDKPTSYNPTHAIYDQVFVAGPAAARRYADHGVRIPADKFTIVGRPQVENVKPSTTPIAEVPQPTVLYAPTWRGDFEETMLYSLPSGERIVSGLLARGTTVIFRPHPSSYESPDDVAVIRRITLLLEADRRRTGRAHLWGPAAEKERTILECINDSDAMVSDVSSVVSDYLFSGKPFAMVAVPAEPQAFVEEFPVARASYVIRGDLSDLDVQLEKMLGADPLAGRRADVRADYLGNFPVDSYAATFVDAVHNVSRKIREDIDDDESGEPSAEKQDPDVDDRIDEEDATAITQPVSRWSRYGQILARVGLDLAGTAIALLAMAVALVGGSSALITLLAALSVWAAFQSVSSTAITPSSWSRLLTEGDATRAVLVLTLAVSADNADLLSWPSAAACGMLLVAIVVERRIRLAWSNALLGRNLPGALHETSDLIPRGLMPLIEGLVIIIGFVLVWIGASPMILLVLSGLVLIGGLEVTVRALRRATEVEQAELQLRGALQTYGPRFAVYFASTAGANYQVGMWLPYFMRIGRPFIVIARSEAMLSQISQVCEELDIHVPLIYRKTLRSVEEVIVDSMTTAFYVNNAARNTHLVQRRELTHVWLNHGDSEKPACFNPVHAIYDLIFAAGQAGVDRYARHGVSIPAEKFRIVGRPQVELIDTARGPMSEIQQPTVLYAPTWQGPYADTRVYSLPVGKRIVEQLLSHGTRVIFRPHPFNHRYPDAEKMINEIGAVLDADRVVTGREHLWGSAAEQEMTVEDCFNASDAMVSDVSAVVSDYLQSGKPFAMVSVGRTPEQLVLDAPAARAAYVVRDDLSNLGEVCDDLLGGDPLASVRSETKIYYLGDFPDQNYAERFLVAAREVIDVGRRRQ